MRRSVAVALIGALALAGLAVFESAGAGAATAFNAVGSVSCTVSKATLKFNPSLSVSLPPRTGAMRITAKLACSGTTGRTGVAVTGATLKSDFQGATNCASWYEGDHLPSLRANVRWKASGGRLNPSTMLWTGGTVARIGDALGVPARASYPSLVDTGSVLSGSYVGSSPAMKIATALIAGTILNTCNSSRGLKKLTSGTGSTLVIPAPAEAPTGNLWTWGSLLDSLIGGGVIRSPLPSSPVINWADIAMYHGRTLALRTDGSLWTWNSSTAHPTPAQVGAATNWSAIAIGDRHDAALRTDGTLWTWGRNDGGQLGQGDLVDRTPPTQVGSDTDWVQVSAGHSSTAAIKANGTLWTWGQNGPGQLGLGDHVQRLSPTQVGTATDWAKVAMGTFHTLAIKTSGTLWAWGTGSNGSLGQGGTADELNPVQVGAATDWTRIAVGAFSNVALRSDGSLWTWGWNEDGRLGLGDRTNRLTPTRVGSSSWTQISAGSNEGFGLRGQVLAIRSDGSLWSWGANGFGQLGVGDQTDRTVPTRVGSRTGWARVFAGDWGSAALR